MELLDFKIILSCKDSNAGMIDKSSWHLADLESMSNLKKVALNIYVDAECITHP